METDVAAFVDQVVAVEDYSPETVEMVLNRALEQGAELVDLMETTHRLGFSQVRIQVAVKEMFGVPTPVDPEYGTRRDALVRRLHVETSLDFTEAYNLVEDALLGGLTIDDLISAFNRSGIKGIQAAMVAINWAQHAFGTQTVEDP